MEAYFIFHADHNQRILTYLGMIYAQNIYDASAAYASECAKRNVVPYVTATFCNARGMRLIADHDNADPDWFCGWTINYSTTMRG